MTEHLAVTLDQGVLTLTNPNAPHNAMSFEYMDAVEQQVERAATDPAVRAIVFTAAGEDNFSVGMNLKQLMFSAEERGGAEAVLDQRRRVLKRIETLGKPTIATLFGYCLGGGLELPLACHFRLAAATDAKIGLPEMDLGTVPAWGGTARLTRCVGRDHALDMILRAKKIDGPRALEIGLVQQVHPIGELKQAAHDLALELAAMPPIAVAGVLDCVVNYANAPLEEALDAERRAFQACATTQDQREGMMAFLEKRKPVFTGS